MYRCADERGDREVTGLQRWAVNPPRAGIRPPTLRTATANAEAARRRTQRSCRHALRQGADRRRNSARSEYIHSASKCDATVYGPPLNKHCTALEGPAVVRISNVT
jgi:hypothetical protein